MTGLGGAAGQSAEVLAAFRELKQKAKGLETEHKEILRENERLRNELSVSRRESLRFRRGAREMQLSDSLAHARKDMESKRKEVAELERDLIIMEDANRSIERGVTSGRAKLASVSDDSEQVHANVNEQELECKSMEEELKKINERCMYLQSRINALPQAKQQQTNRMKEALSTMEAELLKIRSATEQGKIRGSGLHRYIEMMIGINGELCDTILAREEAKARVLRISGKLSPSPSGVGSVVQPYNDVLAAVGAAASIADGLSAAGTGHLSLEAEAQKAVRDARAILNMHSKLYQQQQAPRRTVISASTLAASNKRAGSATSRRKVGKGKGKTKGGALAGGKDLFSTDVNAIAQAAEMFARQATAAANLHEGYGPGRDVALRNRDGQLLPSPSQLLPNSTAVAATAAAASATHASNSPSWRPIELALSGGQKASPVFVPSGPSGKDKFNAFASVSKAVRAAKTWNQQIASQIKSLQQSGVDYLGQGTGPPLSFHAKSKRAQTA